MTHVYIYIFTFLVTKAGVVTDITYIDRFVWGRGFAIGDSITKLWFHVSTISICSLWFLTFTPNIWSCMIQFDFHIFYLHLVDFYDRRLAYIRYIYIYVYTRYISIPVPQKSQAISFWGYLMEPPVFQKTPRAVRVGLVEHQAVWRVGQLRAPRHGRVFRGVHSRVTPHPFPGKMKECFCWFPSKWGSVPVIFVGGYEHVIFLLERKWKWNHPSNFQPSILIRYLRCYICLNLTAR